ncbi:MAG: CapA family protein [Oscillospiraceae bacterium]|nr:CapA family protein [Oscillospiraceae bacterium]
MEKIKERSPYWDNIKGLLILLMVFAHILYQLQDKFTAVNSIVDYIYMFHMPAFVFVSGYFGKSERSRSAPAIIRLLFLYFIFNSITGFIFGFTSLLVPKYSYWYLLALVVWRLTAPYIEKLPRVNFLLIVIAILSGFFITINNNFAVARIIAFYPYYMFGYKLSTEKSDQLIRTAYSKRLIKGIAALILAAAVAVPAYNFLGYTDDELSMFGYMEPIKAFSRAVLFIIAFLAIYALRNISPDKKIPFLSAVGQNSLWVFLLHRPLTICLSDMLADQSLGAVISMAILSTFALCFALGNDVIAKYLNSFADSGVSIFTGEKNTRFNAARIAALLVASGFIFMIATGNYNDLGFDFMKRTAYNDDDYYYIEEPQEEMEDPNIIYSVMSSEQKSAFDKAFRLTFAGDLILLEDQVKRGYTGDGYDFSPVFEYAEKYISSADYAIGVFEGPMAGEAAAYTSGNFADGKRLCLNFPDQFGEAVKNAGFDLVTTANNHVLDKDPEGALRTLDVLDRIGLDHTGSYRNASEKESSHIKLVECEGIKMAVLSYTYGSNFYYNSELTDGYLSYVTSIISGTSGEQFDALKASVERDFEEAKRLDPDLIIVLPHIGTQFSNEPDEEQTVWFDIFKECGADIILGDHPHVVEPALIENYNGRTVFTAYCPGNFANIYRENQGDTSMLIDVYIDRTTKQVIGGGIVPLYTQSTADGNFRAIPIYEIVNNTELRNQLSTDDLVRVQDANDIITSVVFGHTMNINSVTERYYFDETGFIRVKATGLELTDEMKNGTLYKAIERADSICFVGDSLTEGTKNGGCPWYEPIEEYIDRKDIYNFSAGGCTVSYINENAEYIPEADLYVVAVGTNDVRYRDEEECAMTPESYTGVIDELMIKLSGKNPSAEFIFIAPWYSTDADKYCDLTYEEKTALNNEYSEALGKYCNENHVGFINANPYIQRKLTEAPERKYLLDHIHPNSGVGVIMYSEAVLLS